MSWGFLQTRIRQARRSESMTVRFGAWLAEAWPFWIGAIGVVTACLLGGLGATTADDQVRYAGMVLQVLGVGTVAVGLSSARRLFGRPSIWQRITAWVRRVPEVIRPKAQVVKGRLSAELPRLEGEGSGFVISQADGPVEARVEELERAVEAIRHRMSSQKQALSQKVAHVRAGLDEESVGRMESDHEILRKLEEFSVGGVHLEIVGLLWIVLGVVLATIPREVLSLLG